MAIECRAFFWCTACKVAKQLGACDFSFPIRTCKDVPLPPDCPYRERQALWKGEYRMVVKEKVTNKDRPDG